MADDDDARTESMGDLLGRLWTRGRVEVGRAAKRGRDMLHLRQMRNDRDRMYQKLGKESLQLLEAGEIAHPGIARGVGRIRELEQKIRAFEDQMRAAGEEPEPETSAAGEE